MNELGMTRRRAARLIAAATLLPLAGIGRPVLAARTRVRVPKGSFRLERELVRELSDGKAIVVKRAWTCQFTEARSGMTVAGEQVFVDVAAPPKLAALADLERTRKVTTLFPLVLDGSGLIVSSPASQNSPELVRALDTARALFASAPLTTSEKSNAQQFLAEIGEASAATISRLPRDLFFPDPGSSTNTRTIALPEGGSGTITVAASVTGDAATGLLTQSERLIVTRIEGSARSASERWRLARV